MTALTERMPFMRQPPAEVIPASKIHLLLPYLADLELEIDRLRKQEQFVHHEAREFLNQIHRLCKNSADAAEIPRQLAEIDRITETFSKLLRDISEPKDYRVAHDQVLAIHLRPLIEQMFRRQQLLENGANVAIHFDLETDQIEWFPARLRHILENLLSNAVKYRDTDKQDSWVRVGLRVLTGHYELRVTDNGLGMPWDEDRVEVLQLLHRAAPARAAGLGVGLAVVKMLVEQSGGSLTMDSGDGQGSSFLVLLPRYDVDDYLT
jgi:signal transduction histidine kinase